MAAFVKYVCVILRSSVLAQYRRVSDERTDGQTEGQTHDLSIYRASIASRGKNWMAMCNYGSFEVIENDMRNDIVRYLLRGDSPSRYNNVSV